MSLGRDRVPLHERILPMAGKLVPAPRRVEWTREWLAELWHLRHCDHKPNLKEALSLSYGLVADAVWLRLDWVRVSAQGSAAGCLALLSTYCLLCAGVELVLAGSWHGFAHVLAAHFTGGFVFVAVPGVFAAVATYPLRPLKCGERGAQPARFLSDRMRWSLFLSAKIGLTLALGFLFSLVTSDPVRVVIGGKADWLELLMWAVFVTAGLRWALLDQEQRCQRCLRMLSQPTRVGIPSRNFLEWSGTELACADGHGLLHVAEMQGSWCWYDKWVERTYLA
jgi:hypothetical protein